MVTFFNIIGLLVLLANPWLLLAPLPALLLLAFSGIIGALLKPLLGWENRHIEQVSGISREKWLREYHAYCRQHGHGP